LQESLKLKITNLKEVLFGVIITTWVKLDAPGESFDTSGPFGDQDHIVARHVSSSLQMYRKSVVFDPSLRKMIS
jgi:hypothetical protein